MSPVHVCRLAPSSSIRDLTRAILHRIKALSVGGKSEGKMVQETGNKILLPVKGNRNKQERLLLRFHLNDFFYNDIKFFGSILSLSKNLECGQCLFIRSIQ